MFHVSSIHPITKCLLRKFHIQLFPLLQSKDSGHDTSDQGNGASGNAAGTVGGDGDGAGGGGGRDGASAGGD